MKSRKFRLRRWTLPASTVIAALMALTLVALSPIALVKLNPLSKNWSQLSNIGQTYGAISALISSLALGGVVVSLFFQARELRTTRNQNIRDIQHRLIRMEMDDPALMTAIGAPWNLAIPAESEKIREYLYIHMWVTYNASNYVLGEISDSEVKRFAINELFKSKAGREYWSYIRPNVTIYKEKGYYRFTHIIDAAYSEVISSNAPTNAPVRSTNHSVGRKSHKNTHRHLLAIGAALAVGIITGRKSNRHLMK
jgi:hypothetical protein